MSIYLFASDPVRDDSHSGNIHETRCADYVTEWYLAHSAENTEWYLPSFEVGSSREARRYADGRGVNCQVPGNNNDDTAFLAFLL